MTRRSFLEACGLTVGALASGNILRGVLDVVIGNAPAKKPKPGAGQMQFTYRTRGNARFFARIWAEDETTVLAEWPLPPSKTVQTVHFTFDPSSLPDWHGCWGVYGESDKRGRGTIYIESAGIRWPANMSKAVGNRPVVAL